MIAMNYAMSYAKHFKIGVLLSSILVLNGCVNLAPKYERPNSPVQGSFGNQAVGATTAEDIAKLDWRSVFTDPALQKTIVLALDNNRDLRVAMLNIEKARAQYRIQRAEMFPSVDASASQTRAKTRSGNSSSISQSAEFSVGFTSWELDLFGRLKNEKDETLETYFATAETQRSTRMSLIAEVAGDWLNIVSYQQQLAVAQQTLASQEKTMQLTYAKYKEGISSAMDYEEIKTSVDSARADIASYKSELAQAKNELDLVVGTKVPNDYLPPANADFDQVRLANIQSNLDSSVLLNHPDVLYAEHTLKSANADIGAARAAFFPSISLTASAGRASDDLAGLFNAATGVWSFAPSISVPIFNAGELKATLDSSKIQKNIYVAQYEQAIQTAFNDVANALAAREYIQQQMTAQQDLVKSSARYYRLATARYKEGVDDYLTALTAQRTYYTAQQNLISLQLEEATNRVTLYKVLGGGADTKSSQDASTGAKNQQSDS